MKSSLRECKKFQSFAASRGGQNFQRYTLEKKNKSVEFDKKIQLLERKVGAYKCLQWQHFSFMAFLDRGIVPRGLRVLKMPSYGNVYPDLLKQWQQLNLRLSLDYMKLMNAFFAPIEAEMREEMVMETVNFNAIF